MRNPQFRIGIIHVLLASRLLFLSVFSPASAETDVAEETEQPSTADKTAVYWPEEDHEIHHRNYVAGLVGYTSEDRGEGGFTLGAEYSHRFSQHFGAGAVIERVFGDIDAWVFLLGTGYRTEHWKFLIGAGFEDPDNRDKEGLLRLGVTYVVPFGRWELMPDVSVDFVDGEAIYVAGLAFGYGF